MLGIAVFNEEALQGAILQGVNHGLSTGALFLLVGYLYERRHTREISDFGGIAQRMPVYTAFFVFVTMSSIALPLTNGFVGEFLIFAGSFKEGIQSSILPRPDGGMSWRTAVLACTALGTLGIVLGAVYMLSMVRRVFFGPITQGENHALKDLDLREKLLVGVLCVFIVWIGVAPGSWLKMSETTVHAMVQPLRPQIQQVRSPADYQRELRANAAQAANP
jgi:NADH-quinone oxidoreductase subunit M